MRKKEWLILIVLAALKMVLPFALSHTAFGMHRDEYLYYEQGQHLAFGYLENPALIGLLAKASYLAGGSFFWIKFWPAIFGVATLLITAAIAKELGGGLFALLLSGSGLLLGAYLRIHFLFQPNFLEIFSWTLAAYFLVRFINTANNKWLYFLSAALAVGWWSKYSVLFFAAGIVISLALTQYRSVFANRHFWMAALLGILLTLPNIIWQGMHQWPLLHHMKELRATQLQYVSKADFFKEQVLYLLPVAFVWIAGLIWLLRQRSYRILGIAFIACIALIAMGSGKGYYTLGAYPMLLAAGGVCLERWSAKRKVWRPVFMLLIAVIGIPLIALLLPLQAPEQMAQSNKRWGLDKLGLLRWEDLKEHALQQDFADMIGWDEMAQKAEASYLKLPAQEQQGTWIYCRNYGQAGAVKYHAKNSAFRNKVICDNGTFLLWMPDTIQLRNLVFVGEEEPDKDDVVFQQFKKVKVVDSVTNELSRQYGNKVILFQHAKDSANILATAGIKEMKARFGE